MIYPITTQSRSRVSPSSKLMLFTLFFVLLSIVSACRLSLKPSEEQVEHAEKAVSDVRASLYTPPDSKLLAEKLYHGSNPEDYPGCVSGQIYLAYHSIKPFEEILKEYRTVLNQAGWKQRLGYSHEDKNFDVFQLGTQVFLLIDSYPIREDLLVVPTSIEPRDTMYYIQLLYYDPSIEKCSEM
jgi:hypothetical protein